MVRSHIRYGNKLRIDVINFFEINVPTGKVVESLEYGYVFDKERNSQLDQVYLEVEIIEVDEGIDCGGSAFKNLEGS